MLKRGNKRTSGAKHQPKKITSSARLNLKPNEAYEPGFGKYTLTEHELQFGKLDQSEVKRAAKGKLKEKKMTKSVVNKPESAGTSSNGIKNNVISSPEEKLTPVSMESKVDTDPKTREENTNMHNNW